MELPQIGASNPLIKRVLHVQNNSAPNPRQLFVAEGLWAHQILIETSVRIDTFFWCPEAIYSNEARKCSEMIAERAFRACRISPKTLERISERDKPDGLLSLAEMPSWDRDSIEWGDSALVLIADAVEIPGNLGTLIRTLDACKADCLILTNRRTRLTHPKVFRASHGMSLWVPTIEFTEVDEAIRWLNARSFRVLLADTNDAVNYRSIRFENRIAVVVGNERYGLPSPWYEHGFEKICVPMLGHADSLNVSISASIILYEARAQKQGW